MERGVSFGENKLEKRAVGPPCIKLPEGRPAGFNIVFCEAVVSRKFDFDKEKSVWSGTTG